MQVYILTPAVHEWLRTQAHTPLPDTITVIETIEDAKRIIAPPPPFTKADILIMLRSSTCTSRQRAQLVARIGGKQHWHTLLETYRDQHIPETDHPRDRLHRIILIARIRKTPIATLARQIGYNRSHIYEHEHGVAQDLTAWLNATQIVQDEDVGAPTCHLHSERPIGRF